MSGLLSHRSAVFLEEMGVGAQWRLRARPEADAAAVSCAAVPAADAAIAAVALSADDAGAPSPVPAAELQAHPAQHQAPAADLSAAAWDDAPVPSPAPRPPAAAPTAAPPAAPSVSSDESTAWFDDAPAAAPRAPQPAPLSASATEAYTAPSARGPVSDEEIAVMDWPALQAAVKACTRCALCKTREAAVPGRGDEKATWVMLDTAPNQDDEEYAEPITGNPGRLLDNMLRAVDQSTQKGAYITTLVKCRPSNEDGSLRAPGAQELQACRPYLERELELTQAKVVVAFGHTTGKGLLGAAARGRIMMHGQTPVVATYHPADLLKRPEEKAKAWADLCLAKSAHAGRR